MTTTTSDLTAQEQQQLTWWKWAYIIEDSGFTRQEARHIAFIRELVHRGTLNEEA